MMGKQKISLANVMRNILLVSLSDIKSGFDVFDISASTISFAFDNTEDNNYMNESLFSLALPSY